LIDDPHKIPEEMSLFYRTEETYRKLWFTFEQEGIDIAAPVLLKDTKRFSNPYLSHAERFLFAKPQAARQSKDIELITAPDRRAEVDAAARKIRQWMLDGFRLRDIAVLTRSLDNYAELIDASFREHAIPYFVDRRRAAAHHPVPQVVRAILLLALHNWPHDAVMTLLKSGLCGLSLTEADEVENYVLMHRIRGAEWASTNPWRYVRSKLTRGSDEELAPAEQFELERIDGLRRKVVNPLRPFLTKIPVDAKLSIRQYIVELFAVLERFNIRKTLLEWIKDTPDLEQRGEHEQVWAELIKLLDQMADVMGEELVQPADFLAILESGLEQFDLALTPPTVDQVLVGGVERTRTPALRATIVLGLNEGEFPHAPRDQTILSDGERRALAARKMEIDPDTQRRLLDENFLGYIAFTRGSERLLATRAASDDAGRAVMPSQFWKRVRATFPDAPHQEIRRDDSSVETIGTPRQLVTRLMRWVRDGAQEIAWTSLYQWLSQHQFTSDAIDVMRFRAWRALAYDNQSILSSELAKRLFPSPLGASVSRIETFATCPFKHFARYGLELNEREDAEVSALDLGNVYHGILEQLVRDMVRSHKTWGADPKNITDQAISKLAKEIGESLKGELMLSSARNQYLLAHVERTLGQVIDTQSAGAARGRFKPIRAELEFGSSAPESLPPLELKTPEGNRLRLRGKIDRVDLLEDQAAFAVIDYKLSGSQLSLDRVYHGISLQLLTYLLVLQANGQQLAGKKLTPAAAFYVKLLRQLDDVKHPSEATPPEDEAFHLSVKPRGLIHRKFLGALDDHLGPGVRSEVVQAALKRDGELGHRNISDAAEASEFAALLRHVEKRLGQLGDQIIAGRIDVSPFRMGQITPCPSCDYRAVCRFDTLTNRYNHLTVLGREGVLEKLAQEATHE
jgi:ATP-dependent helicase/nuclease subunit B